jgi:hypothetical protein
MATYILFSLLHKLIEESMKEFLKQGGGALYAENTHLIKDKEFMALVSIISFSVMSWFHKKFVF